MSNVDAKNSMITWLVLVVSVVPGIWAIQYFGALDWTPYLICTAVGLIIGAGALLIRARLNKKRSAPDDEVITRPNQLVPVLIVVAPVGWTLLLGLGANRLLDSSSPQLHHVEMVGFEEHRKGPDTVRVTSWRRPGTVEEIRHDYSNMSVSQGTPPETPLIVLTRDGALGWSWVSGIARDNRGVSPSP